MIYDITIIGAGASGLMLASKLQNKNLKTCIIDSNKKIAQKIKVSGGGKCNITNKYMNSDYFLGDSKFIQTILDKFTQNDLLKFLNQNGVYPKINEKIVEGTYFCNSSDDIIDMFKKLTSKSHFKLDTKVIDVSYIDDIFTIETSNQEIKTKKLIVASGGVSYSAIGASDVGFKIAKKFGHRVNRLDPALVGFTVQKDQFWFKELSGLSLDEVVITVGDKKIKGGLLFTHKGCSGPAILTTSLYWQKGSISIDFAPNKESYLPKRFKQVTKNLKLNIHNYIMSPAGNFGYTKAEVTKGGVDTSELTLNLESKLQKNLYFIGEVVDVTGELGGYNFQWAFSSGYSCCDKICKI
ncbi:MAG: aminoacetone oxidase family FAD-binding enzyme [Campylobacterota bacterium]|nr:aminoacetone oxidase family FAD-binding enzyme [Campylobacterota bacterium]